MDKTAEKQKNISSILVANRSGVLMHVAALFAQCGINIDSLTVGETENPENSRITVVSRGIPADMVRLMQQLQALEDVKEIREMGAHDSMSRELLLIKVRTDSHTRQEVLDVVNIFRAKIIDYARESIVMEVTGEPSKIDAFIDLMRPYTIVKLCRTGIVALERG